MFGSGSIAIGILVLCFAFGVGDTAGQTWDGGGPTNNWSDPLNWSTDTVPNSGANVTFNTTSTKDCVIDIDITTGTFLIDTGYSGTISQGTSIVQHSAGFTQRDGTFVGGSAAHRFNGARTFTAGSFIATSGTTIFRVSGVAGSTTLTVDSAWSFDPNGGTIVIEGPGSGGSSVNVGGTATELTVHNLVINSDANSVGLSLGTSGSRVWNIAGTLQLVNGVINGNADRKIRTENAVLIDAAFDGGGTFLELVGDAERVITIPAGAAMPNLVVNAPNTTINTFASGSSGLRSLDLQNVAEMTNGSVDQTFSGPVTIASNFTQGSGSLTFNGSFTQTGGLFTGGTGTIDMNVSRTFSGGTFVSTSGELIFTTSGTPGSQTLVIEEGWTFDPNGGTVVFDETGSNPAVSISGAATTLNLHNLRIAALTATGGLSMGGSGTRTWTVNGALELINGSLGGTATRKIAAAGPVQIEPTFDGGGGTIDLIGELERTVTVPVGVGRMPNININAPNTILNTSGEGAIVFRGGNLQNAALITNGNADISYTLPVTLATNFTQGSGSITFTTSGVDASTFTQTGGQFTGGTGNVIYLTRRDFLGGHYIATSGETIFRGSGTTGSPTLVINNEWTFDPNGGTWVITAPAVGAQDVNVSGTRTALTLNNLRIASETSNSVGLDLNGDTLNARVWTVGGQLHLVNGIITGAATRSIRAEGEVLIEAGYDGGNVPITYSGSLIQNFQNLGGNHPTGAVTIDKSGGTLNLLTDMNFSNGTAAFTLAEGTITTGDFAVLTGTRSVSRTNGFINGNLQRRINSVAVREYPVGTANGYSPVTASITALGTNPTELRIGAKQGTHPRLDPASSLVRYWPITESGNVTATLTFNYLDTDVNGIEEDYRLHRVAQSELQIFQSPQATIDTTANTATVTGITEFSDWTLAEVGQPVSIAPQSPGTVAPGTVINFSAIAGYPPYTFALVQDNSGASFDPQTGQYMAGQTLGGVDTVRVTDSFGFTSDATITVDIIPTRLVITAQPVSTTAGLTLNTITAELQDDAGNRATTATNAVTIAFANNPSGATLLGTTARNAVAGIATFNDLSIQRSAEGYTLAVSSTGLTGAGSNSFNISPGDPTQLVFIVQPSDTEAFAEIEPAPQVVIRDQFGNTVETVDLELTISIASNPGSATLSGTSTRQSDGGVATFNGLSLDRAGTGYTLAVNGSGLEVESDPFNISSPILLVTTTDPTGPGSLAEQISISNQRPGRDTIHFNIPGNGPFSIQIPFNGILPVVSDPVVVDATTQPGYSGIPLVELHNLDSAVGTTLLIDADNTEIRGLLFNGLSAAIHLLPGHTDIKIKGNRIGLDHTGEISQITPKFGILARNTSNLMIGAAGEGNIIAASVGISLTEISDSISVKGNLIGTNAAGTIGLGGDALVGLNAPGISLQSQLFNSQIGGTGPGEGNLFSGHRVGLSITGDNNVIEGNKFGTDLSGTSPIHYRSPLSLKNGVYLFGNHNTIGGNSPESGNTFAFLDLPVHVAGLVNGRTASEGNLIRHNSSHSSSRDFPEFIYLQPGAYNNDPLDADEGPNWLQNYPILTSAVQTGAGTQIIGTFSSEPSENYLIDFYLSDICSSNGGFGDAKEFLGSVEVTTDSGGLTGFGHELPFMVPVGKSITALATDSENNTSQLSRCRLVAQNTATISGTISDASGPLSNVLVVLNDEPSLTTATDSLGNYSFTELPTDVNYFVRPWQPTYEFTPPSRSFPNLISDQPNSDFTAQKTSFRITGTVGRLGGATLTLTGTQNRTSEAHPVGTFRFDSLPAGNYTLTPSKPGYTFNPTSVNIALSTEDANADFSAVSILSQLTGRFYFTEPAGASTVNIRSIQADGRGLVTLLANQPLLFPDVAPDGRTIFMSGAVSAPQGIYSANFDGTGLRRRTFPSANRADHFPGVSADGSRVAFIRTNTTGDPNEIRTMAPDGSDQTLISLTAPPLQFRFTSWNANGLAIASVAADRLRIISTGGSVNTVGPIFGMPRWSPDGTRILSRGNGLVSYPSDLFTYDPENGSSIVLGLNDPFVGPFGYGWSPDGLFLNYVRFNNSNSRHELVITPANSVNKVVVFSQAQQIAFKGIDWAPTPQANVAQSFASREGFGGLQTVILGGVTVTFADVQSAGELTVDPITPQSIGELPAGLAFTQIGYDISTTATFTPPAEVCISIPETTAESATRFGKLVLLHRLNGSLANITTVRDFPTRTLCGQTNSFSEFIVAEEIDASLASITGLVVDENGEPMVGVTVRLSGGESRYVETDADGLFTFPNLINGANYEVQARTFGRIFTDFSKVFIGISGENAVAFVGSETGFAISGRITNQVGTGIPGRTVEVTGDRIASTTTDADGNYEFIGLPADGTYTVRPTGSAVAPVPEEITVSPLLGDATGQDFIELAPTSATVSVGGRVLDAGGHPISLARVEIVNGNGNRLTTISNSFGFYRFEGILAGETYVLTVSRKGLTFQPRIVLVSDEISDLDLIASSE